MGSRVKEEERNEKIIRGLLKLPGNRRCINCNSLGPQYVCTSFSTFICTLCSGIHREFTHRVKSISVAKFTSQEVSALQEGGNERAKEIYFKHGDFGAGPDIDNSDVDRLRTFIKNVYVEQKYTDQRRIGDHLAQTKGNPQESSGNSNADSSRGVLRGAYIGTSENNHGPNRNLGSLSENQNNSSGYPIGDTVDQNNSSTGGRQKDKFRNHLHPDDVSKTVGNSENNQKYIIASTSSVVQAPKDTSSTNKAILHVRLPDPPSSQKVTISNISTKTQKPTSDSSPATVQDAKLYVSKNLIDFDSDLEPPQSVVQTEMQKKSLPPTDVGWATFDDATPKKPTYTPSMPSTSSLEGSMLQLPDSGSVPQSRFPTAQTAKSLSFSQVNHGGQQHQHYFSPVNNIQSKNIPLNRATSAPVNSQLWRSATHAPTIQGNSTLPAHQRGSNILIGTAEVTSNGRKALPEDMFAMTYPPVPSAWNWQLSPRVNMEYGQSGTHFPVGVNTTQYAHTHPINPVNLARGSTPAHAFSRFPSSMHEAMPIMGSTAFLSHASGMGSVGSVLSPAQVPFPLTAHDQYMVHQHAVRAQNNTLLTGGSATTATAYGLSPMDQRMSAQTQQTVTRSSLPRVGRNPFA